MNKSLITKILIGLVIVIIVIVIANIVLTNIGKDKEDDTLPEIQEYMTNTTGKIQKIDNIIDLAQIQSCIQKYYLNYFAMYGENTATDLSEGEYKVEDYKNSTYKFLSPKYISKAGITLENINSNLEEIRDPDIEIYNIYFATKYEGTSAYFVNGIVRDSSTYKAKDFNMIVVIDDNNQTYEIYMGDYLENSDFSALEEGQEVNFDLPTSIENRGNNTYGAVKYTYDDLSQDKFDNIRGLLLRDVEKAYELLTDDAKANTFKSVDELKQFINNNRKDIFLLTYGGYVLKNNDGNIIVKMYDDGNEVSINVHFNGFTNYRFEIEGM